jgi:hypothetical protein
MKNCPHMLSLAIIIQNHVFQNQTTAVLDAGIRFEVDDLTCLFLVVLSFQDTGRISAAIKKNREKQNLGVSYLTCGETSLALQKRVHHQICKETERSVKGSRRPKGTEIRSVGAKRYGAVRAGLMLPRCRDVAVRAPTLPAWLWRGGTACMHAPAPERAPARSRAIRFRAQPHPTRGPGDRDRGRRLT